MHILAADIGGTKTLLQLASLDADGNVRPLRQQRFESGSHETFDALLGEFLRPATDLISAACFAVAGPVIDGEAQLTNLHWGLKEPELSEFLGCRARLVNDFHAVAAVVTDLGGEDVVTIHSAVRDREAPVAIIGAGTGLGEAFLIAAGGRSRQVVATEGGHTDFAPIGQIQRDLLAELSDRFGHVSYERILSGDGIVDVHRFFAARAKAAADCANAAEVFDRARSGDDVAARAVELFIDVYGAEAGNLALKTLARGGVFIAGGIAAKHADLFTDGRFMRAFTAKGRFEPLMKTIPVSLVTAEDVGVRGATALAADMVLGASA